MRKHYLRLALGLIVSAFVLGACGSSASNATPTPTPLSVEAISTAAVQTAFAQLTEQAPTITPTPVFTNTPNVTATPKIVQPTATKPAPTAATCANMQFVSDVTIPDGTRMSAGTTFTKTWRVKNIGTCAWTTNFKVIFSYGEAMSGKTTYLAGTVDTGATVDISINMIMPNKTGQLTGVWALEDDRNQPIGKTLTVVVSVGAASSPTPTGNATETPTSETTSTSTPSSTPTETATP